MTVEAVITTIVGIVAGTTPTSKDKGLGPKFVHSPNATRERLPTARGFLFEMDPPGIKDPMTRFTRSHYVARARVVVRYPKLADAAASTRIIVEDAGAIALRLANPENWDRTTSLIITLNEGELTIPSERVDLDDGSALLIFSFPLEYRLA